MRQVVNDGVRIRYDVVGEGKPLMLLHGWACDPTWWSEPGYVDALKSDHRLVIVHLRGHGLSDKPHDRAAYTSEALVGDVFAVADAERFDRFAIWGLSLGGWIAWMAAATEPSRIAALVASGAWDPRPVVDRTVENEMDDALREGGTRALVELFRRWDGERFDREFPPWAREVTLRADAAALLAIDAAPQTKVITTEDLASFPVPVLLIAGELDDVDDDAAKIAALLPNGHRLRLAGLGHGGASSASAPTVGPVRSFLDRWFA